jgi:hypothetical protein
MLNLPRRTGRQRRRATATGVRVAEVDACTGPVRFVPSGAALFQLGDRSGHEAPVHEPGASLRRRQSSIARACSTFTRARLARTAAPWCATASVVSHSFARGTGALPARTRRTLRRAHEETSDVARRRTQFARLAQA